MYPVLAFGFGSPVDLFVIVLLLLPSIFWLIQLIDVLRRHFPEPNNKIIWVLVILFTHLIGALVYYFVGRKQGTLAA